MWPMVLLFHLKLIETFAFFKMRTNVYQVKSQTLTASFDEQI